MKSLKSHLTFFSLRCRFFSVISNELSIGILKFFHRSCNPDFRTWGKTVLEKPKVTYKKATKEEQSCAMAKFARESLQVFYLSRW